jgi:pyridoxamine 5'-phosphate oxidase
MPELTTNDAMLPSPLPADPFALFSAWLDEATRAGLTPNPNAMCVATVDEQGRPAARIVLCKRVDPELGLVVFFTNYESAKGRHLAHTGYAEAVFLWDAQGRQARLRGPVLRSPSDESDAYFQSRARASRIAAWASRQSQPIDSREALLAQLEQARGRFGDGEIARPPHWGGQRIWPQRMELWISGDARLHDRAVWTRDVTLNGTDRPETGPWSATRLQP